MRAMTIRVLALAIGAAAAISVVTAAEGETSTRHVRKHHAQHSHGLQNHRFGNSLAAGEARPIAPQVGGGDVCPGLARSIDCRIWPPPVVDDPDRKNGGGDGAM